MYIFEGWNNTYIKCIATNNILKNLKSPPRGNHRNVVRNDLTETTVNVGRPARGAKPNQFGLGLGLGYDLGRM